MKSKTLKQQRIDRRYKKAKAEYLDGHPYFCESCGANSNQGSLAINHTIKRGRSKRIGKEWLIWYKPNFYLECTLLTVPGKSCHDKWDSGTIGEMMELNTFWEKLRFIKQHDPEQYQRLLYQIKEHKNSKK